MWIMIMGVDGSGKSVIAEILEKRNYQKIEHRTSTETDFGYMAKRLSEQLAAQAVMNRQDVFTFRSIWDSYEVMHPTSVECFKNDVNDASMQVLYDSIGLSEHLQPPHCVVYTKLSQRDIQDRLLLKGKQPNDEEIVKQIEFYEKFITKIRVPLLEIDMAKKPEDVANELNFSIDSMRATAQSSQTVWRKTFFY